MEIKNAFLAAMNENINMALANSVDGQPNVRLVTYAYDEKKEGVLYFTTFPNTGKISEFEKNNKVCLTLIPNDQIEGAQVRIKGIVKKSACPLEEITPIILAKAPYFKSIIDEAGDVLIIYEIQFDRAEIVIGMSPPVILTFEKN